MLTAGDEFGRSQRGNNNAYAQDNATTWLDWAAADIDLAAFTAELIRLRREHPSLSADRFLTGARLDESGIPDVVWLTPSGREMQPADWGRDARVLGIILYASAAEDRPSDRTAIWINGSRSSVRAELPAPRRGFRWSTAINSFDSTSGDIADSSIDVPPRSVIVLVEEAGS